MPGASPRHPFPHPLRVYWEDTDAGGVVFYANYLKYFERARTEWLRSLGFSQERLRTESGVLFVVSQTELRCLRPARLDDLLHVSANLVHAGQASMTIAQQAQRVQDGSADAIAAGTIRIACVDLATWRPRRIPESILATLA